MQLTYEIDFHEREFEEMVLVIICARSFALCAEWLCTECYRSATISLFLKLRQANVAIVIAMAIAVVYS